MSPELLAELGFFEAREVAGELCALQDYMFTRAIVLGIDEIGYKRRYCFENRDDANRAIAEWDGTDHPPGNWIKLKGTYKGEPVNLLNPNWSKT